MLGNIKHMISRLIKHELFWLMLICFTIRHILYQYGHTMFYNTDTVTYHYAAQNIFKGIIDGARTPVYPMLIKIFEWLWPETPFQKLVYFQHILSYISIIPFYMVCKQWMKSNLLVIVATIVWGCFFPVIKYNNGLFAESILISSLVWLIWLFSIFIVRPTAAKAIVINLFLFYLVMLKPASLVYYGIFGVIWSVGFLFKRHLKLLKPILVSYFLSAVLLLGYCALNKYQNDCWSPTTVSHDNLFVNVIFSGAYRTIPDDKFVTAIDTSINKDHYYTVFYLNNDHDKYQRAYANFPLEYMSHFDMRGAYLMPESKLGYSRKSISSYLKKATKTKEYFTYVINKPIRFLNLNVMHLKGSIVYLLMLAELILVCLGLRKSKNILDIRFLNLLMTAGIIITFFIGGVIDGTYGRVLLPLAPFLVMMFMDIADTVVEGVRKINPLINIKIIDKPDDAPEKVVSIK